MSDADRSYYERNRDLILAKRRVYREANRQAINDSQRCYRDANRERIRAYHASPVVREAKRVRRAQYHEMTRNSVFCHYTRSEQPACSACGIADLDVLTIDHIFGGGRRHRHEIRAYQSATAFYRWLVRNNFPDGFQVLCQNCNTKKYKVEQRGEVYVGVQGRAVLGVTTR